MKLSRKELLNVLNRQLNIQMDRQDSQRSFNKIMLLIDTIAYLENPDFSPEEYFSHPELRRVMEPYEEEPEEDAFEEFGDDLEEDFEEEDGSL